MLLVSDARNHEKNTPKSSQNPLKILPNPSKNDPERTKNDKDRQHTPSRHTRAAPDAKEYEKSVQRPPKSTPNGPGIFFFQSPRTPAC